MQLRFLKYLRIFIIHARGVFAKRHYRSAGEMQPAVMTARGLQSRMLDWYIHTSDAVPHQRWTRGFTDDAPK